MSEQEEEPVPKIGRGRHRRGRFPMGQVMQIAMLLVALIAVLALRRGCAEGVANMFRTFAPPPPDAGAAVHPP